MKTFILILVSLLLTAGPALSQVPNDRRIVPGKRIGKWTLAMTMTDLVRMNGRPTRQILFRAGDAPTADSVRNFTRVYWEGIPVGAATVDRKTVISLILVSGQAAGWQLYKTDEGIGLESPRKQVLKVYGKPTAETTPQSGQTRLIYDKIGIAFHFYADGTMRNLLVFRPGKSDLKF